MRKDAYVGPAVSLDGARFLRLLADETRLRVLSLLVKADDLCVCELVAVLRLPQYQISRHLGPLRRSGLLTTQRRGPFIFYGLAEEARRHPVLGAILRRVPQLTGRVVAAGDLGRMRRLMKLEKDQRTAACDALEAARTLRRRPILSVLNGR